MRVKRTTKKPNPLDEEREAAIARAVYFRAVVFRGSGHFEDAKATTLETTRELCPALSGGRAVGIYAVWLDGTIERAIHIENWEPPKKPRVQKGD